MENLIKTLKDLKENRHLSSECEVLVSPFVGKAIHPSFSFLESGATFASRLGDQYKDGKTVIAKFADTELDCAILFPKTENDWVEGLAKEDEFQSKVTVLEFDNLYQRVVLGYASDQDARVDSIEEDMEEPDMTRSESSEPVEPAGQRVEESVVKVEKEETTPQSTDSDQEDEKSEVDSENDHLPEAKVKEESKESFPKNDDLDATKSLEAEREKLLSQIQSKKDISKKAEPDKEVRSTQRPKSLRIKRPKKKIDPEYLAQLKDKRYAQGEGSLTDEEKKILKKDSERRKKKALQASKGKEIEYTQGQGCQFVFAILLLFFSMKSCTGGSGVFGFILLMIAVALLVPLIKHSFKD